MSIFDSAHNAVGSLLKNTPIVGGMVSDFEASQEADKIKKLAKNRPKYSRPDEVKQLLENARANATSQMPGYDQAQQNIDRATAFVAKNIKDMSIGGGNSLAAATDLAKKQANMYGSLALQNEQYHQSQKQQLQNALKQSAQYSDQEFEFNQNQPWQFDMNWAENKYAADQNDAQQSRKNTYALAGNLLGGMGGGNNSVGGNKAISFATESEQNDWLTKQKFMDAPIRKNNRYNTIG
jgi:hypothetical protein